MFSVFFKLVVVVGLKMCGECAKFNISYIYKENLYIWNQKLVDLWCADNGSFCEVLYIFIYLMDFCC